MLPKINENKSLRISYEDLNKYSKITIQCCAQMRGGGVGVKDNPFGKYLRTHRLKIL